MTSNRPYLLRALNEWILDNGLTPYILVDAEAPGTSVPGEFVQDGRIILNISPSAVKNLLIDNEVLTCTARFGGKSMDLSCPVMAITAIYARENGYGMIFPDEGEKEETPEPSGGADHKKPELKVIK